MPAKGVLRPNGDLRLKDMGEAMRLNPRCLLVGILVILALIYATGCGKPTANAHLITDSFEVLVEPGRGVTNVCELEMTFKQVKRVSQNATLHKLASSSERCILLSTLGAIANLDANGKVSLITFYIQPYDSRITSPGLQVTNPFRGKLGGKLSFQDGPVRKGEVEEKFGKIQQGLVAPIGTITNVPVDTIKRDEPLFVVRGDKEEMYYPHLGLRFDLERNVVVSFGVSKPVKPGDIAQE